MKTLNTQDLLALGLMTFALFVGAGNIIFPPIIGLQAGLMTWKAALGFLLTGVGLPILTLLALARAGGEMRELSRPLGRRFSMVLAVLCYLAVGPLFATPRTATVSFEVAVAPLTGGGPIPLAIYSLLYFLAVVIFSFYPGRLLDSIGRFLAPLKILALVVLGVAAYLWPAGSAAPATGVYQDRAFIEGVTQGYLTMDTLAAMVFGIVIVNAIRSRGVERRQLIKRYTAFAGLIAGAGLVIVYLGLFHLGSSSAVLVPGADNGAQVLRAFVEHTFGVPGTILLSLLIGLACVVTAIGLTCACAKFFSQLLPLSYRFMVVVLAGFSMLVSNLGLSHLIQISLPLLTAIYPPCIALVLLSFTKLPAPIVRATAIVAAFIGIADGLHVANLEFPFLSSSVAALPFASMGLAWFTPALAAMFLEYCRQYFKRTVKESQ
ncbi:branched-chain amino acid transport system II carrier protein [Pseudomonas syringae pv. dysoxyli]|uniref:branched-chain amino acid transport system II carrier protein n=1 Tax=Pseudomonas syringae TaxID=317 RepID=UPI0013735BFF|nr:branched-chain amino acid transport system II carrier protein [Pseudomonas syringae]NAO28837.1 branched-chain amino acid transport system II carrier protein [Pseudomonas syringae pv. dysoxyli]